MATGTISAPRADTGWVNIKSDGTVKYRVKDRTVFLVIDNYNMTNTRDIITIPAAIKPAAAVNPFTRAQYDVVQSWIVANETSLNIQAGSARTGVAGFAIYPI